MEKIVEFVGGVKGAERNFLALIGSGSCKSFEIMVAMFKLISSL